MIPGRLMNETEERGLMRFAMVSEEEGVEEVVAGVVDVEEVVITTIVVGQETDPAIQVGVAEEADRVG